MGKLSYTTVEVNEAVRKSLYGGVAIVANDTDNPDVLSFTSGEVGVKKLVPLSLAVVLLRDFIVATNGVQYKGNATRNFAFNATAVVGSSAVNTIVHFVLAKNGVFLPRTESAVKLDTATSLSTIDGASGGTFETDDILQVYAYVNKACTISVYHTQLQLFEI